jgi:hypothetical protein
MCVSVWALGKDFEDEGDDEDDVKQKQGHEQEDPNTDTGGRGLSIGGVECLLEGLVPKENC